MDENEEVQQNIAQLQTEVKQLKCKLFVVSVQYKSLSK